LLTRFDPNWLALGPPLIVSADQIDDTVAILDQSIAQVLAETTSQARRPQAKTHERVRSP
jgi:adenosylmethionine-8-amino-7-oxononanoate aminotransferase